MRKFARKNESILPNQQLGTRRTSNFPAAFPPAALQPRRTFPSSPHLHRNILQPEHVSGTFLQINREPGALGTGVMKQSVYRSATIHAHLLSHTVCTRTMHPTRIFWVCSHQSSANSNPSQSFPISFSHPFSLSLALAGGGQHQRPPQLIHTHLPEATCVCVVCVCA